MCPARIQGKSMKRFLLFWTILSIIWVAPAQERNASSSNSGANEHSPIARETHVTAAEALNVGYTFMHTCNSTKSNDVSKKAMQLIYTGRAVDSLTRAVTDCYYVFALQPKGFVIVAADERVNPILGYSYDNNFVVENMPDHVRGWLGNYERQIETVVKQNIAPETETTTKWSQLKSGQAISTRNRNTVGPLLTTTWDQGQYYNAMCPEDAGPDGHALVGCVATAMAQIINYWGYPEHGRGSHSYSLSGLDSGSILGGFNDYGTFSVNFDSTTYDYDNMPDVLTSESTQEEIDAVAQLMYHCGVAVNTFYGTYESGAIEEDVRGALISYFGFAHTLGYAQRQLYTDEEWTDSLKSNLDRREPVFYTGSNLHAFVLDGYNQEDFFHFNFGWSGYGDGWYLISAINPSGWDLNEWQSAIMGIRPSSEEHAAICHRIMNVQNNDYFMVTEPIDLYPMRGGSTYRATNEDAGVEINLNLVPEDESGQLVLDVLEFDNEQSVVIYDGINKDSLVRVIETRKLNDYSTVLFRNWLYEGLPSDSIFQNIASVDFSPIVSTRHGLTVVAYSRGGIPKSFHLRVSDASDCRMVSNLTAIQDVEGLLVSWTENGDAAQWQVMVEDTTYNCNETHVLLTELLPDETYKVKVRAICDEQHASSWNTIVVNKKVYWTDVVTSEPEGYLLDGDTIRITTPEGLAWLAHCITSIIDSVHLTGSNWAYYQFYQYSQKFISIENDLDLYGYYWEPIPMWFGNVNGHGHVINNMVVSTFLLGGLFTDIRDSEINDIRMINSKVNSLSSGGSIAGCITNCSVNNCSSENYLINVQNSTAGGLFGTAGECQINNCYAYGNNYSQFGYGGLAGAVGNSEMTNCVTSLGKSFNWTPHAFPPESRGLLTAGMGGGSVSNCFSDISNAKWYNSDPETYRSYFLGGSNVDVIENLAVFNISIDPLGMLIADTAVNYTLGENMDVVTALNNKVAEYNSPDFRTWIRDSVTYLPVFGDFYEVTCPNVSNISASNIPYNNGFAVDLSWQEAGDAEEWQIKYKIKYAPDSNATIFNTDTTNVIIEGLELSNMYEFYVRPLCGDEPTVGWGLPFDFYVDKTLWIDVVTSCPEGYVEDNEGNIMISSAEGLAWFTKNPHICQEKTISIVEDIDMGAYRWTPMGVWDDQFTGAVIEGNNHVISNLYCHEFISDPSSRRIGFFGYIRDASIYNLTLRNSSIYGHDYVGSLFGEAIECTIDNCHVINSEVKGYSSIGGLGGMVSSYNNGPCYMSNCSASGTVIADQAAGGLLGVHSVLGSLKNCYANCDVTPLRISSQSGKGGLIGEAGGAISNCYSIGSVEFNTATSCNYLGSLIGGYNSEIQTEISSLYAQKHNGLPLIGGELDPNIPIADTASIVNGALATPIIIGGTSFTNMLEALNAWVDANNSDGIYRRWAADSTNVNGGYPVFAAIPCVTVTSSDTIVACDSYTWHGDVYTTSTELVDSLLTSTGCDSVVTHYLIINQSTAGIDEQTACESFTWINGETYTESTNEPTFTRSNSADCDSVVTLHLTITNTYHTDFTDEACDSYTWNGNTYTQSGDYPMTLTASNGCDSVVTLHLTINHSATSDEYLTICENELPYHYINGQIDTTFDIGTPELLSLNYYLSTENGCDSIVTLYLTVSECLPPDEDAPFITEAHISGLDMIIVTFNEAVDSASAINAGNYSFSNGMTVTSVTVDSNMVYLTVSPSVTLPDTFLLTTSNITDMAGNTMSTETIVVGPPAELICENIAQLRTKMDYTNTNALVDAPEVYRLTGSVVVTANLQIYNQKVIQDSTAAIYIFDPNNVLGNLEIGDQVRDIQGTLRNYFGYLEFIPVHTYQHFEAAFVDVEPLEISLAQLNDNSFMINHQAELIKLDSVSITSTGNFAILNRYDLLQNGVTAPALYTYFREADYIYQPIPTEMLMNLKGFVYATSKILTNYYDFRYYIVPRWENDMMILPTVPVVITSEVSDIMATSAICGGNVTYDGNDYVTARGVCWSTASNPTLDDFHTTDGSSGGAFSSTLTGLVPNTTYYVRAYATNSLGTSYGEETSFTSLCDTDIQVLTIAACGEYTWNDSTYTTSGDYMSYGIDAAGCDSVVTLHLTINHSATSDEFLTISENELPYHYVNGQIDTTFDIGTPELLSLNYYLLTESGCDSIVTLHLTIIPYDTITLAVNDTLMGSVALAGALPEGATVLGNGSYRVPRGSEISVKAVFDAADFGFLFWTNGNDTLSVDSVYTFTVTGSSEYTAHIEYLPTPYFYVSKTGWATWINPHSGPGAFIRVEVKAADSDQWETLHYSSSITSAQLPLYMLIDSTLYTVRAVLHNYEPSFESRQVTFDWFYVACDHFEGVSNFVGELTDQGVALSWDAGEGPQQYLLYRNYLIIDTLTTTNYFDTSGVYSNKYYVSRVFGGSAVCPYNNDSLSMSCQIAAKVYVDLTLTTDPPMFGTAAFVLPDNTGHVAIGGTCTVSATANEGYSFTHWTFNGTKVSVQSTYTFDVEQVGEVVAHFEYAPATDLYVSRTGWATWNNPHGQPGDNSCVSTQVTLKSLDGQVLFTQTFPQSSANHCQLPTSNLADSTLYLMSVVLTDTAGNSSEASIQWYYVACDHLSGFTSAAGTFSQQGVNLNWDYPSNMTFTTATVDFDFFNGFVTDTAVMSDGGDASWAVEPQSTAGPYCNYASNTWVGDRITLSDTTRIYEMEVYAFQSDFSTTSPFTGLYIQIYQGNPEDSVLVWGSADSNLMTATAFTGCYRGSASNPMMFNLRRPIMSLTASGLDIELAPGTYYLVWSTSVSNTINPVAIPHCKPVVGNTGDYGMLFTESRGWRTMHDGGSGESFGFAFHLTGEQVLSPVVEPESAAIYRDGELIDTTSATTYMDPEGSADHSYEIRVVYGGDRHCVYGNAAMSMSCLQPVSLHCGETFTGDTTAVACESFSWQGITYTESGDYTYYTTTATGCDSVVILHLTIYQNEITDFTVTCQDSCYTWNDQVYCNSGDYNQTLQTVYGCDSVVTLHLTITVGVDDYEIVDFKVYPNPTNNFVNVQCTMNNGQVGAIEFQLFDAFGKLVNITNVGVFGTQGVCDTPPQTDAHGSSVQTQIDLSHYAAGVYFVKAVADGNVVAVRKMVKR